MNSIEQFWGNNKPQQAAPEQEVKETSSNESISKDLTVKYGRLRFTIRTNSEETKEEFREIIWKRLVNESTDLEYHAANIEDYLQDGMNSDIIDVILKHHRDGMKIITSDGELDGFLLDNIDRLKNWETNTVHKGKDSWLFYQSPIMKDIVFDTDYGLDLLDELPDDDGLIEKYRDL